MSQSALYLKDLIRFIRSFQHNFKKLKYSARQYFVLFLFSTIFVTVAKASDADTLTTYLTKEFTRLKKDQTVNLMQRKDKLLSLSSLVESHGDKETQARYWILLSEIYLEMSWLDSTHHYLSKIAPLIHPDTDNQLQYDFLSNMGRYLYNIQQSDSAIWYFEQCIELSRKIDNPLFLAMSYNNLGIMYEGKAEYQNASENYFQAVKIFEELGNNEQLAVTLNNLGVIMQNLKEYDKALEYLNRALLLNQQQNNKVNQSMNYGNIGIVLEAQSKFNEAIEAHKKSLDISIEENIVMDQARNYHNMGRVYFDLGKFTNAEEAYLKSKEICKQYQLGYGLMMNDFSLAMLYNKQNKLDEASQLLASALRMAKDFKDLNQEVQAYKLLAEVAEKQQKHLETIDYLKHFIALNDSMTAITNRNFILEIQEKYETDKKALENHHLKQENESKSKTIQLQKTITIIVLVALLTGIVLLILLARSRQKIKRSAIALEQLNRAKEAQNQQLNELNTTKDILFSIIGHDLRSPFNTLLGFLQLVIEGYDDMSAEERVEVLKQLYSHSNNTFTLLENLLQWAMSQRGQISYNPSHLDVHQLIEQELIFLKSRLDNKKIIATNHVPPESMVFGDKEMLLTIFRNLINNAIKFTDSGGSISISSEESSEGLKVNIADSGVGISPDILAQIQKNEGVITTRGTQNEKGSGLGLLIIRDFLQRHGGSLSIESEPGKGSCFSVFLPRDNQ